MTGFEDARLLLVRAHRHRRELSHETGKIWQFMSSQISESEYEHRLMFIPKQLPNLKPIVADVANNLRHSLDHVAAQAARMRLGENTIDWKIREKIKFPFPSWNDSLELSTDKIEEFVSPNVSTAIKNVWDSAVTYPYYLHVVRVVSGAAKHWELRPIEPTILAIQPFPLDNGPIEIPENYFAENRELVWRGAKVRGINTVEKVSFGDIDHRPETIPLPLNPDTVFSTTATYVKIMIEAVEAAVA